MASKLAAKEDTLGVIHELTAQYCKTRLQQALETNEPIPPAELGAITKFLRDNSIECTKSDMEEKFGELLRLPVPAFEELEEHYG